MNLLTADESVSNGTPSSALRAGLRWLAVTVLVAALARILWVAFRKRKRLGESAGPRGAGISTQPAPLQSTAPVASPAPMASSAPPFAHAELVWLGAIVLIAVGLRIAWVAYLNVDPSDGRFDDGVFYHNAARLIAHGDGFMNPYNAELTAHRPPVFPATLAGVYAIFGWHVVLAKVINIAFGAVTVVLVYLIGRRVFDQRVAVLGALVLALFPGQIYFSTLVYAETMFAMIFTLVLLLTLVWTIERSDASFWQLLFIGALIGTSALVRVEGILLVFVLAALWAVMVRPWQRIARYASLALLGAVLAITPWTVRNAIQLHEFVPLRANTGSAIARAVDLEAEGIGGLGDSREERSIGGGLRGWLTRPWDLPPSVSRKVRALYENDSDGVRLATHSGRFPEWVADLIRVGLVPLPLAPPEAWFTGDYEPPLTQEEVAPWRRLADRYFFAVGAAALVAAAAGLVQRNRGILALVMVALVWTLVFGVVTPATRYHFPLGPIISILAGAFLVFVWDGAAVARRWRYKPRIAAGQSKAASRGVG